MADVEIDFFALFLALGDARLSEARAALEIDSPDHARKVDPARVAAALIPLAVDAALLGAEGVSLLALALAECAPTAARSEADRALLHLSNAVASLGHADASGARADESALMDAARVLRGSMATDSVATSSATHELGVAAPVADRPAVPGVGDRDEVHWVPSLPEELIGPFLDECQERIESLATRILQLEEGGPDANGGEEIRALFRDLHTLKGSSGFAGLARMNRLAHAAEDLVAKVRDKTIPCTRPVIDVLLAALDRFRSIIDRAAARAPIDVEVDEIVQRLADPSRPILVRQVAVASAGGSDTNVPKVESASAPSGSSTGGTLRVEFERIDQLQNFVNELVLARGRLTNATSAQLGIAREIGRIRRSLDERSPSPSVAEELGRTERVLDEGAEELELSLGSLSDALGQLRDRVMKLRMIPIARLFTKHQRVVRELGQQLGKRVRLDLVGQDTELDKMLVEQLEDPLVHLVRNAIDHGIEAPDRRLALGKPEVGTLSLRARQQGGAIVIEIADDGGGIDSAKMRKKGIEKGLLTEAEARDMSEREALELIFHPGFSTAEKVTDVSGRGVGMDVVHSSISALKGGIEIRSEVGVGTTFELRLPLTLAIAQVLLARAGGAEVAIPIDAVVRTLARSNPSTTLASNGDDRVSADAIIEQIGGRPCLVEYEADGSPCHIPVIDLALTLGLSDRSDGGSRELGPGSSGGGHLVVLHAPLGEVNRVALSCDALLGRHEVVVKPIGTLLSQAPCVAGASLIGERVVILLDLASVVRRGLDTALRRPASTAKPTTEVTPKRPRILVAEDADVIREALRHALHGAGLEVVSARDGEEALDYARVQSFDLVSTDVMMPRLDGYGLTRALRALPGYEKVPIVMVTSRDQRVDVLRGYDAGVDAYVTKPADVNALLRTIEELLARKPP